MNDNYDVDAKYKFGKKYGNLTADRKEANFAEYKPSSDSKAEKFDKSGVNKIGRKVCM